MRNWNTVSLGLLSLLVLISFAGATTFYSAKPLPNFASVYNMTFTNWQFQIRGNKSFLALQPSMTVSGVKYKINATTPNLSQFNSSVINKTTNYKFSFNVSVPAVVRTNVNSFSLDIVNNTGKVWFDNDLHLLYMENLVVNFSDLVASGFSVTINSTNIVIGNLAGKTFNFDPTVTFSTAVINGISMTPLDDTSFILGYCDDTGNDHDFQIYYTNGTSRVAETVVDGNVYSCQDGDISVTTLTTNLWAYCEYEYNTDTINLQFFNSTGQNVTPFTKIATSVWGYSISCSALNATDIVFLLNDAANGNINSSVWHYAGSGLAPTKVYGQSILDTGVGGGNGKVAVVSVTALNSTAFFECHGNYDTALVNCTTAWNNGTVIARWTADSGLSSRPFVSTACFNSTACSVFYYDYAGRNTKAFKSSNWWTNGTQIGSLTIISPRGDDVLNKYVSMGTFNSTHALYSWYNATLDRASVWTSAFATMTAAFTVATPTAGAAAAVASRELATNIRFCSATDTVAQYFVYAYKYSATVANWTAYYSNGTAWNGVCPAAGGASTSKALYDSATYAENAVKNSTFGRVLYDVGTYAELQLRNLTLTLRLYDYKTYAELLVTSALHPRTFYDSVTYNELQTKLSIFPRVLYDSATYAEYVVKNSTFYKIIYDTATYAESIARQLTVSIIAYEQITYNELMSRSAAFSVMLYDIFSVSDAVSWAKGFTVFIYDAIAYAESIIVNVITLVISVVSGQVSVVLPCNATSYSGEFTNVSLYLTPPGGWTINETQNVSGTTASTNFTKLLSPGTYRWNCQFCTATNCSFADQNASTIVNLPSPTGGGLALQGGDISMIEIIVVAAMSAVFAYLSINQKAKEWKLAFFILSLALMYVTIVLSIEGLATGNQVVTSSIYDPVTNTYNFTYGNVTDTSPQQQTLASLLNPINWLIYLILAVTLIELLVNGLNYIATSRRK